ncbi:hypothetical protein SDC9_168737 [bioreactor metagenome]|uniref:Uncharacterized protein n=1 Tax=bioreactor metagenome TaxID=1076179 RepID=A0A645G3C1_9ZZZZ
MQLLVHITAGHNLQAAIRLQAGYGPGAVFSRQQTALDIIGQAIGVMAGLAEYTDCTRKYQFIDGIPCYIAKQEILL